MLFTPDTFHLEMSPLNDDANASMARMLVHLDVSHFERSPLNLFAPGIGLCFASTNKFSISVTAETSQAPIGLYRLLEQSVDSSRHSAMAVRSCALVLAAHPEVGNDYWGGTVGRVTLGYR